MRLDRLPPAMLAEMATLRGETVTFGHITDKTIFL